MATNADIDATLERYYAAWTHDDPALYRTIWADGAVFADPPTDGELPATGVEEIVAAMAAVQARATAIHYDRRTTWYCGHSVAVHSLVTLTMAEGTAEMPLLHVFRFADDGRIRRLEAFFDLSLVTMVAGERPAWMVPAPRD